MRLLRCPAGTGRSEIARGCLKRLIMVYAKSRLLWRPVFWADRVVQSGRIGHSFRFSSVSVSPRRPLTGSQPAMPGLIFRCHMDLGGRGRNCSTWATPWGRWAGACEAHGTGQHIEKLRQLVQGDAANDPAHTCVAAVVQGGLAKLPFVLGHAHGPKFPDADFPSAQSVAPPVFPPCASWSRLWGRR